MSILICEMNLQHSSRATWRIPTRGFKSIFTPVIKHVPSVLGRPRRNGKFTGSAGSAGSESQIGVGGNGDNGNVGGGGKKLGNDDNNDEVPPSYQKKTFFDIVKSSLKLLAVNIALIAKLYIIGCWCYVLTSSHESLRNNSQVSFRFHRFKE